jgi:hypothetical protein
VAPQHDRWRDGAIVWGVWVLKVVALLAFVLGLIVATTFLLILLWGLVDLESVERGMR